MIFLVFCVIVKPVECEAAKISKKGGKKMPEWLRLNIELERGISPGQVVSLVSFLTSTLPQPHVGAFRLYSRSEIFIPSAQLVGRDKNLENLELWAWGEGWWPESIASLVRHWFKQQLWPCRIEFRFKAATKPSWRMRLMRLRRWWLFRAT